MNEVEQLRKENQLLEEENKRLKNILKQFGYNYADENLILNKDQRLEIFLDYFKGRNDVYANKYYHQKKKRFEYSFVCSNKFKSTICPIKNKKPCTTNCPYFSPVSLTKDILLMHMQQSNHVVGIYPLLEDDTCYLLAMDFDDDMWFENLLSVYRVAKKYSVSSVMERSQSGNGGHLWIFFKNKIKASKARQLGDFLLKEAMKNNKHLKFNSFDRMFPSQDYLTGHGLGNLIALPLQADAINNGNSLFINEYEQPIRKPFHYLSSIVKIDEIQIDQILNTDSTSFKEYFDSSTTLHVLNQINQSIEVKEDSLLTISKKGLSSNTLLTIRKIASVYNPDFYEKLRLHLSVYKTPRVLCEYIEDDYTISIPRGLKNKLFEYIDSDLLIYKDNRSEGKPIEISFMGSLWNNQEEAITSLMNHDIAMLEAIPGFGKTVLALNIMATLKRSTLIIVNNKELLDQWKEKIDQFIDYPKAKLKRDHFIGEYHGSKKRLKYNIDIALIQSLSHLEDLSVLKNYGLVLIDECHHASSETYRTVLQNLNAKYIYSFSGTPQRKDKKDKIITMYLGDIVYKTNKKEIIENRSYEQILIPRITTFKVVDQDVSYGELW